MPELEQPVVEREPIDDTGSLAEHEATFQPKRGQEPKAPVQAAESPDQPEIAPEQAAAAQAHAETVDPSLKYQPKEKKQSEKHKARPADVPRINELTRKLREAEEKLAAAEARASRSEVVPAVVPPVPQAAASPVAEKFTFPSFDTWSQQHPSGTYEDWSDAKLDARDTWRDARAAQERQQSQVQQSARAELETFAQKRTAYLQQYPDRAPFFDSNKLATIPATPLMERLLKTADNGPDILYTLQTRPDLLADLVLRTDGKPASPQYVALAMQWLQPRLAAGVTGAAAPPEPQRRTPKPPTPVRTRPMQTTVADAPGDGSSLAEHEAFFNQKRRR